MEMAKGRITEGRDKWILFSYIQCKIPFT